VSTSSAQRAGLEKIRDADTNIAIWRRPPMIALSRYATAVVGAWRDDIELIAPAGEIHRPLAAALPRKGIDAGRARLLGDVRALAATYADLAGRELLHLKLERIDRDKCPLFHADYVGLRLLTTYCGPGTEWLPEDGVDRGALGDGSNDRIVTDRRKVRRLEPFWVGVLKGDAYEAAEGRGCVHRSPPVEARGTARLLLTIDDLMI
jgi:hypothetical protein